MKLTRLAKDPKSSTNGCPAIYLAENEDYVAQGQQVSPAIFPRLGRLLPGEAAVRIPAALVYEIQHFHVRLNKIAKDPDPDSSIRGGSAIYMAENEDYIARGRLVDPATFRELEDVLPGETAVWVPGALLNAILRLKAS